MAHQRSRSEAAQGPFAKPSARKGAHLNFIGCADSEVLEGTCLLPFDQERLDTNFRFCDRVFGFRFSGRVFGFRFGDRALRFCKKKHRESKEKIGERFVLSESVQNTYFMREFMSEPQGLRHRTLGGTLF
jgi:hypothetical protein